MKSLKDFKCGLIIPNKDIFDEITIKASPPIYKLMLQNVFCPKMPLSNLTGLPNKSSLNHANMGVQTSAKVWYVGGSMVSGLCEALFRQQVKKHP